MIFMNLSFNKLSFPFVPNTILFVRKFEENEFLHIQFDDGSLEVKMDEKLNPLLSLVAK